MGFAFDTLVDMNTQIKADLDRCEELISSKNQSISDLQFEVEVLNKHRVETIKMLSDIFQTLDFHTLWLDFDHKTHKFTKNAGSHKFIVSIIIRTLFGADKESDIKFLDILSEGWESYAYEFRFSYFGKHFSVKIPVFARATEENFKYLYYEFLEETSETSRTVHYRTRFLEEFQKDAENFLKIITDGKTIAV